MRVRNSMRKENMRMLYFSILMKESLNRGPNFVYVRIGSLFKRRNTDFYIRTR